MVAAPLSASPARPASRLRAASRGRRGQRRHGKEAQRGEGQLAPARAWSRATAVPGRDRRSAPAGRRRPWRGHSRSGLASPPNAKGTGWACGLRASEYTPYQVAARVSASRKANGMRAAKSGAIQRRRQLDRPGAEPIGQQRVELGRLAQQRRVRARKTRRGPARTCSRRPRCRRSSRARGRRSPAPHKPGRTAGARRAGGRRTASWATMAGVGWFKRRSLSQRPGLDRPAVAGAALRLQAMR